MVLFTFLAFFKVCVKAVGSDDEVEMSQSWLWRQGLPLYCL